MTAVSLEKREKQGGERERERRSKEMFLYMHNQGHTIQHYQEGCGQGADLSTFGS